MTLKLPNFLGVGTQKGGTTTLHELLRNHSRVYVPQAKEIHYFDQDIQKSQKWYARHFENARKEQKCGEITPYYLFHPEAAARIKKALPEVKILILLRDPVERTISHLLHAKKRGFEQLDAKSAIKMEKVRLDSGSTYSHQKHSYVSRSKYINQIIRYEEIFAKDQIMVKQSEFLFTNQQKCWIEIQEFLNIEKEPLKGGDKRSNYGRKNKTDIDRELREYLEDELYDTAIKVQEKYGITWDWASKARKVKKKNDI